MHTHHLALVTLALSLPAICQALVPASAVSYAQLMANGLSGQWAITLATGKRDSTLSPHVCNTSNFGAPCNQPPLMQDNGDVLQVSVALKNSNAAFKTLNGNTPVSVEFRLCYAAISLVNRAWRGTNKGYPPPYGANCPVPFNVIPFSTLGGSEVFDLGSDLPELYGLPTALYYVQACTKCAQPGGGTAYCACDNTAAYNTIETKVMQAATPGMIAAAVVCAVASPAILAAYWIMDSFVYRRYGHAVKLWGFSDKHFNTLSGL